MKTSTGISPLAAALSICLGAFAFGQARAEMIYRCVENGRINFTSSPTGMRGDCQPFELKVTEPNPKEVAKQLEQKRLAAERERMEETRRLEELKYRDIDEKLRKAESAKEAMNLLRQNPMYLRGGRSQNWSRRYPHYGTSPPERYIVNPAAVPPNPAPTSQRPPNRATRAPY